MPNYAHSRMIWAHLSILRFCHGRGQIKRWGAVRHVIVSGISMRVFFIFCFLIRKQFSEVWTFHLFLTFLWKQWFDPKVPQKCPGPLWDHSRPIMGNFGPIPTTNHLHNYIRTIPIKSHIKISYHFSHKPCLVGFRNSGCEHKGSHSREIPDPPGPNTEKH